MKKINEINKKVKEIYEELKELEESMKNEKTKEINFDYFRGAAKQNAFKDHVLKNESEYIQKNYLYLISSLLMFDNKEDIKNSQVMYISRLIEGFSNKSLDIENIYSHTMIMNGQQISDCIEIIKDYKDVFVVDSLICANIKGKANDQILEYLSEIYFLLGITFDEFSNLINLSNYIFEKDKKNILKCNVKDLNRFKHHINFIITEKILYDFTELDINCKGDIIILNNYINLKKFTKFSSIEKKDNYFQAKLEELGLNEEVINLDKYSFKSIKFINCEFDAIVSIICTNKKILFENCIIKNTDKYNCHSFEQIKTINLKNANIINCKFVDCESKKGLLYVIDCELNNIEFKNCKTEKSIVFSERCKIKNIYFNICSILQVRYSNGEYIINLKNSYIENAIFSFIYAEYAQGVINLVDSELKKVLMESIDIKDISYGLISAEKSNLLDVSLSKCEVAIGRYNRGNLMYLRNSKSINHKFVDCRYSGYSVKEVK